MRKPMLTMLLFLLVLTAGCSSTVLTGSWKNPEYAQRIDSVYIVGVSKNETTRRIFEDAFDGRFAALGIGGHPSYRDIPVNEDDKDLVMEKARGRGADAILMCRMIKKRTETVVTPGRITSYGMNDPYPYPYYRSYGTYYSRRYETVYEPPSLTRYEVATIEANLFDTATGDLVWSAQLETTAGTSLNRTIDDFIGVVIDDLRAKGLI